MHRQTIIVVIYIYIYKVGKSLFFYTMQWIIYFKTRRFGSRPFNKWNKNAIKKLTWEKYL